MTDYTEKNCPECGQRLRFPKDIGGLLMVCPSCGKKFYSDFKLGDTRRVQRGIAITLFEMPSEIMRRLARYLRHR